MEGADGGGGTGAEARGSEDIEAMGRKVGVTSISLLIGCSTAEDLQRRMQVRIW